MATTWKIDPTHSEVQFKVKHLMITTVSGQFKSFDLTAETEAEDFKKVNKLTFSAEVNSVDTNNAQRDEHLKSAEFFDAETHPQISITADAFDIVDDEFKLNAELTIKGTTKPVTLNVDFGGIVVDPYGQTKAGFTVTGKISRKEFGLTWNAVTEAGQVVVSDEIKLIAEIQVIKQ